MTTQTPLSPSRAWYMIGALWITYVVSFLDRMILSLLIEPIKADFGLSDFQSSLLVGLSFVLFYVSFGLPVAYLADQSNRKRLIMIAVTIWGTMTALCGTAKNFTSLLLFRFGVGAGESALHPSALSMIADAFEPERRTLPMSIFLSAATAGVAVSFILGSAIVGFAKKIGVQTFPIIGEVQPWQLTLLLVAAPTLICLLLLSFVKEPPRVNRTLDENKERIHPTEILQHLLAHPFVYIGSIVAPAIGQMSTYAFLTWLPAMFERSYNWPTEKTGALVGITMVAGGLIGTFLVPVVKSYVESKGVRDSAYIISVWSFVLTATSTMTLPFLESGWYVLGVMAVSAVFSVFLNVLPQVSLHLIAVDRLRAQITAIWLFTVNLIGFGLGPTLTAILSDVLAADGSKLRLALAIFASSASLVAALIMYLCRSHVVARIPDDNANKTIDADRKEATGAA